MEQIVIGRGCKSRIFISTSLEEVLYSELAKKTNKILAERKKKCMGHLDLSKQKKYTFKYTRRGLETHRKKKYKNFWIQIFARKNIRNLLGLDLAEKKICGISNLSRITLSNNGSQLWLPFL